MRASEKASQGSLLAFESVTVHYGPIRALRDVSLVIYPGEILCLLGGNASGKSTTMKAVMGVVPISSGRITFEGNDITGLSTAERVKRGIGIVPENRRIFPKLTVRENLMLGAFSRTGRAALDDDLELVFSYFPRLKERLNQPGGTLSGGEQQMLAMGRALMSRPKLVLMDEPSMGLSPRYVSLIFEIICRINEAGVSLLIVEQNARAALSIAHRGYVLQTGEMVLEGPADQLLANEDMKRAYLGHA